MIKDQLSVIRLELATPKSRMLACKEGVPFCGFRFIPGVRPRILGTTKRRFEKRYQSLRQNAMFSKMTQAVFAWYQFSHEGNAVGLRRAWGRPRKIFSQFHNQLPACGDGTSEHGNSAVPNTIRLFHPSP